MDILIIGLGTISAKHIIALRSLNDRVNIYALRSAKSDEIEGISNIYSLTDLKITPKFAIISNPTNLHLETIVLIAKLNIPLFIEKPPAHTIQGSQEVIDLIKTKNLLTYVACNLRFHPCIQFLKSYLQKVGRKINEVNIYCGSYLPDWRPGKDYRQIYSAKKDQGGGVHLDLFHEMDYTCWLFGLPNNSYGFYSNKSSLKIDAADYANYLFSYPEFNASIILNYYRSTPRRSIEVIFDSETWIIDLINNEITSDKNGLVFKEEKFEIINTYIHQMQYFLNCLRDKLNPMNSFEESIKILNISLNNVSIKG